MFASGKDGISALSLQRSLEIGAYATAWAMLQRLRSVLARPGRDRLIGMVEVDEIYIGGEEPGLAGGRAKGKKVLVSVAVEVVVPRGFGRCWMQILPDASAAALEGFITGNVGPGAHVTTDGWSGYRGVGTLGYTHEPRSQRAAKARGEDPGHVAARRPPGRVTWPSAGCWARTKPRSHGHICRATSTSSCSGSTGAVSAPAACFSIASSNSPSLTPRFATASW